MKNVFIALLPPVLAGCLAAAPGRPAYWTLEIGSARRVASATVCAPYSGQRLAVLRPDGSVAFDPCNSFAASPSAIVRDALVARGAEGVLSVRRLALDCRKTGRRDALVELEVTSGGRVSSGSASEPTADGNYTAAFSRAFERACAVAFEGLSGR